MGPKMSDDLEKIKEEKILEGKIWYKLSDIHKLLKPGEAINLNSLNKVGGNTWHIAVLKELGE